jgi:hypothetical protein
MMYASTSRLAAHGLLGRDSQAIKWAVSQRAKGSMPRSEKSVLRSGGPTLVQQPRVASYGIPSPLTCLEIARSPG